MKVCQVLFALVFYVSSIDEISPEFLYDADWPALYFKNGETATVPCTPRGEADAYFWRKGESYNVSEVVAYNTRGFITNSTKYRVLSDGYLIIHDFSISDQGRYFCRILSDTNECYGTVNIYLKVSKEELNISIVQCRPLPSCEIKLKRSSTYNVTCLANLLSPTMELIWSNGSEAFLHTPSVIMDIDSPQSTISSTIMLTYTTASYITCKAINGNVEDNVAGLLLVDLDEESSSKRIVTIFLIILSVLLVIICLIFATSITLVLKKRKKLSEEPEASKHRKYITEDESLPRLLPLFELQEKETKIQKRKIPYLDEDMQMKYYDEFVY